MFNTALGDKEMKIRTWNLAYKSLQVEKELRMALERNEFQLYYQPKVDLETGKTEGVEALIRWKHPKKVLIPPL